MDLTIDTASGQIGLFDGTGEYEAFVEKFKPKKTTDDCYTPPLVYEAVADWVAKTYGVDKAHFVRPFYPGGDYQAQEYGPEDVVVDNPPFSILAQIERFYTANGVRFFLFAPALTLFSGRGLDVTYLPCSAKITYENRAVVNTSFVTNLDADYRIRSEPSLHDAVEEADRLTQAAQKAPPLPKYSYPDHIVTAAMLGTWCGHGVGFRCRKEECVRVSELDAQKPAGKSIFGGGFLLSERAAAERAAAERAAAERAAATRWKFSERELEIVKKLSEGGTS